MRELIGVVWKTVFFYFLLLVLMRVTGKREIHALSAIDLVGFIMISEAALISIADGSIPFYLGLAPVVLLGFLELLISYASLKSRRIRDLVEGIPSIVIEQGKLNKKALASLRYNLHDLLAELRSKDIADIGEVEYAILEPTGKLSVIPKAQHRPVTGQDLQTMGVVQPPAMSNLPKSGPSLAVIVDGEVDAQVLAMVGKDQAWLTDELAKQGRRGAEDILLGTINAQGALTLHPYTNEPPGGGKDQ